MVDRYAEVPDYLLDELENICQNFGPQETGSDREILQQMDLAVARRMAGGIEALFGVRLTADDLVTAGSLAALGALVQAALSRRHVAARLEVGAVGTEARQGAEPAAEAREGAAARPGANDRAVAGEGTHAEENSPPDRLADGPVPLSCAQRRIWFMQQLATGTVLYNVPTQLDLTGPLAVEALRAALTDLLARHEILRTRYPVRSGVPAAEVLPKKAAELPLIEARTAAEVDRLAEEQATIPFRLERELPARFLLVRHAADRHVLIGTFHHIAVDGLTLDLLARDLGALYGLHAASGPAPSPPSWRYTDFARHESAVATSAALQRAAVKRCAALSVAPFPLELPTDLLRPRFQRFRGSAVATVLGEPLTTGVRCLARQRRVTPFAVLLAALAIVLRRAADRPDIVVGTPAAGRTRPEWRDVAGCFINIVPVLAIVRDGMSGEQVISCVGEAAWQALEGQDIPFEELVRMMARRRDVPPLTVMFSYQVSGPPIAFAGLADAALSVSRPPGTAKYDLSLYAVAAGPELRLELEYDTDLYTAETADAVLHAYRAQLAALVQDPAAVVDLDGTSGFEAVAERCRARAGESEQVVLR